MPSHANAYGLRNLEYIIWKRGILPPSIRPSEQLSDKPRGMKRTIAMVPSNDRIGDSGNQQLVDVRPLSRARHTLDDPDADCLFSDSD